MSRIRIDLPAAFHFSTSIPVRITDINYGGHAGNDAILSLVHEARMRYLAGYGYSEMSFAGVALIMADAGIEFKSELFYGETVVISVTIGNQSKVSFDIFYKLEKEVDGKRKMVAAAKTGMVCFDYRIKKIAAFPEEAKQLR
ncbi:MAG: acyl-CoA thioesterase [Chitinophagaceae bacterium]|nr:MAG: acyl-CoA thioesterase [Chitinophagaceae bacterium]